MNNVFADRKKNRLYMTLHSMTGEDGLHILETIKSEIKKLRCRFTCLVDIRNLTLSFAEHEAGHVAAIQHILRKSGMSNMVRVVGQDAFRRYIHNRMNDLSRESGYAAVAAETFVEADRMLDTFSSAAIFF